MYKAYSTLQSDAYLQSKLSEILPPKVLDNYSHKSIREVYNKLILKYYPNELSIKSSFMNKKLLKKSKTVSIFEYPLGSSRVDLCSFNSKSTAYEIKTDLDNFTRLKKQTYDYLQMFEYVYIICSTETVNEILTIIPECCGIYTYYESRKGNYVFKKYKPALYSEFLTSNKQLNSLQKRELLSSFNCPRDMSKKDAIHYIDQTFSDTEINKQFISSLKRRYQTQWDFLFYNHKNILEIDYQWFFKNPINPTTIYSHRS